MTLALVASVTVTPVAAEDDLTLGSDGVSLGDEDGVSVSSTDADAGVSVSADADTDGVDVAVEGSGGGTSGGVECDVNSSTDGTPCSTTGDGGSGGDAPSAPDLPDGERPEAPSGGGGSGGPDAGQVVEDSVGQAPSTLSTDRLPLDSAPLPVDPAAGVTRPGVAVSEDGAVVATRYVGYGAERGTAGWVALVGSSERVAVSHSPRVSNQNDAYRGAEAVQVRPEERTAETSVRRTGPNRTVATTARCDLSAGWLRLCGVKNDAPVTSDDLPKDQLPDVPEQVKTEAGVSKGLLFLVADTAVQEPSSAVYLALGQAGQNTPEQSPVNPANPPYNPNQPPVDLADPQGSIDPNWGAHRRQSSAGRDGSIQTGASRVSLNDEMVVESQYATILRSDGDQVNVVSFRGSDGQNQYRSRTKASDQTLQTRSDGPVGGSATLGQDQQTGSVGMALGGQEYERSFGGDGGSAPGLPSGVPGSLPVDPSQPPSSPV